jgi:MtaA/CmuA family methyltransferase
MMNAYQRYHAMLQGQAVDHIPRIPILMQYATEYIGSDYAAFASDPQVMVKANRQCAQDFGIDLLSVMSDPYCETQGFGSEIVYLKNAPPRSTHPLAIDPDISQLPTPDPYQAVRMRNRLDVIKAYYALHHGEYPILGWVEGPAAEAADLRDVSNFMMDLLDDEGYVSALMDRCIEVAINFAQAQVDCGADTIGIGDAVASQVSSDIYHRLIQPREKQLVQAIQSMGAVARLHICGNITHLLPGIADLQVDILDVDHMVDMTTVRDTVGKKVCLAGNIDPVNGILYGDPETIHQQFTDIYHAVGHPYMVNAGCEIPSGTPVENLKAVCKPIPYRAS